MAKVLSKRGKPERAEPLFKQSIDALIAVHGPEHIEVAEAMRSYARWLWDQGREQEGKAMKKHAKLIRARYEEMHEKESGDGAGASAAGAMMNSSSSGSNNKNNNHNEEDDIRTTTRREGEEGSGSSSGRAIGSTSSATTTGSSASKESIDSDKPPTIPKISSTSKTRGRSLSRTLTSSPRNSPRRSLGRGKKKSPTPKD